MAHGDLVPSTASGLVNWNPPVGPTGSDDHPLTTEPTRTARRRHPGGRAVHRTAVLGLPRGPGQQHRRVGREPAGRARSGRAVRRPAGRVPGAAGGRGGHRAGGRPAGQRPGRPAGRARRGVLLHRRRRRRARWSPASASWPTRPAPCRSAPPGELIRTRPQGRPRADRPVAGGSRVGGVSAASAARARRARSTPARPSDTSRLSAADGPASAQASARSTVDCAIAQRGNSPTATFCATSLDRRSQTCATTSKYCSVNGCSSARLRRVGEPGDRRVLQGVGHAVVVDQPVPDGRLVLGGRDQRPHLGRLALAGRGRVGPLGRLDLGARPAAPCATSAPSSVQDRSVSTVSPGSGAEPSRQPAITVQLARRRASPRTAR